MKRHRLYVILFIISFLEVTANSVNKLPVQLTGDTFSVILTGHWYGDGSNYTGLPASTVWANIDRINKSTAVLHMGDLFMDVRNDYSVYLSRFFSKIKTPIFNAVGNHDISGEYYYQNIGITDYNVKIGSAVFIILNTERDNGEISLKQMELFADSADVWLKQGIKYIFFCSHRPIWLNAENDFADLFPYRTKSLTGNNFNSNVLPILKSLSRYFEISLVSGSKGDARASVFYSKGVDHPELTYVISAIRGNPSDSWIELQFYNDTCIWNHYNLVGMEQATHLADLGVSYWKDSLSSPPFNWRLLPLYILNTVLSFEFYGGIFFSLLLGIIFLAFKNYRRL